MNAAQGLFISFEGIDGAGKSSHIEALAEAFRAQGHAVVLTREPGGTPLAEKLRALVLHDAMDPLTEALLLFAARRDHVQQVILPALVRGAVVLCDRFTDASFAYQGSGRGFDTQVLLILEQWVQQIRRPEGDFMLEPGLTLWFDLDPAVAASRLAAARAPDRFEAEPGAFFARVAEGYRQRSVAAPQRFARIEADRPLDAVRADVLAAVRGRGWLP